MKLLKKNALVAILSAIAAQASAMKPIADADLATVSGQDGVSIAADLNIHVGDFTYTNTSANGGSVSFKNIDFTGAIAVSLDVISGAAFATPPSAGNPTGGEVFSVVGLNSAVPAAFYSGGDVVKIAVPNITSSKLLNLKIGAISMGGSAAGTSFGSLAMNDIKLQGTTVYIWAH